MLRRTTLTLGLLFMCLNQRFPCSIKYSEEKLIFFATHCSIGCSLVWRKNSHHVVCWGHIPKSRWLYNTSTGAAAYVSAVKEKTLFIGVLEKNIHGTSMAQFSSVQSLSCVWLFETPWPTAHQASLSITNSWSLPKLMSIELAMPSNHLIHCRPLLLLPSIIPSIRIFSNESALCIRWPKYWSFSFNISPSNEHPGLISFIWSHGLQIV